MAFVFAEARCRDGILCISVEDECARMHPGIVQTDCIFRMAASTLPLTVMGVVSTYILCLNRH